MADDLLKAKTDFPVDMLEYLMRKAMDSSNQPGSSREQPREDSHPHRSVSRCAHIAEPDAADRLTEGIESKMRVELSTRVGRAECVMARLRWGRRMDRHWNPEALRRMRKLRKRLRDKLGEVEKASKRTQDARRQLLPRDLPPHQRRGRKLGRSPSASSSSTEFGYLSYSPRREFDDSESGKP